MNRYTNIITLFDVELGLEKNIYIRNLEAIQKNDIIQYEL